MLEVKVVTHPVGFTGRCTFCWRRQNTPERVVALIFDDDGEDRGLACLECLGLPDAELRANMRETADFLMGLAENIRDLSYAPIHRPAQDVLALERQYILDALRADDDSAG